VSASQLERTSRSENSIAAPLNEVLVRPLDDERAWFAAVCEEPVPPGTVSARQHNVKHAQYIVAGIDELILHLLSLSDRETVDAIMA